MPEIYDTLLLLALPASGKSEVRTYLSEKDPKGFHMGPTVQIDDYPYVHLQLCIDDELAEMGRPRLFHSYLGGPFTSPHDWGALVCLLNDDYANLRAGHAERPKSAARDLFVRLDRALVQAGGEERMSKLPADVIDELARRLEPEARKFSDALAEHCVPGALDGKTLVIEFARGGPEGSDFPLPDGYGYAGSVRYLAPEILASAAILYIWVSPEESRRKNRARARPDGQGSILFHGTPEDVMYQEYGCDDMEYLMGQAEVEGTLRMVSHGKRFNIPVARFDNRVDKTSFLRKAPADWTQDEIDSIHSGITEACDRLWASYSRLYGKIALD